MSEKQWREPPLCIFGRDAREEPAQDALTEQRGRLPHCTFSDTLLHLLWNAGATPQSRLALARYWPSVSERGIHSASSESVSQSGMNSACLSADRRSDSDGY